MRHLNDAAPEEAALFYSQEKGWPVYPAYGNEKPALAYDY